MDVVTLRLGAEMLPNHQCIALPRAAHMICRYLQIR